MCLFIQWERRFHFIEGTEHTKYSWNLQLFMLFLPKTMASIECVNAVCWFSIEFSLVLCWFLFRLFWPIRLLYNIALFWTCFTNRVIINTLHVWLFFSVPLLLRVVQFDCYFDWNLSFQNRFFHTIQIKKHFICSNKMLFLLQFLFAWKPRSIFSLSLISG